MSEDIDKKIANNRKLPVIKASTIPGRDPSYVPTEPDKRAGRLRKVSKKLEAELLDALQECAKLGPQVKVLLGEFAPDGAEADPIAKDLDAVMESLSKLHDLVEFLEEKKMILLSDGRNYIDNVRRQYNHYSNYKGNLSTTFRETLEFTNSISEAISEGIAESKKKASTT